MVHKAQILTASAGSGKTFSLAREYIYNTLRLQEGEPKRAFNPYIYRTILAVTFTNKATEEMKSRILTQINNLATGAKCEFEDDLQRMTTLSLEQLQQRAIRVRSAILHDYSRFAILTNDTFFQRIVRAFVKELGIDINYSITLDTAPVIQKSVEALIEQIDSNSELQQWLMEFAEENIEQGRQWNIKRGILRLKSELFKEQTRLSIESINKSEIKEAVNHYLTVAEEQLEAMRAVAAEAVAIIASHGYSHADFAYGFTAYFDAIASFDSNTRPPTARVLGHCEDEPINWFKKSPKPSADMLALAVRLQPMLVRVVEGYEQMRYLYNSCTLLRKNYRSFALLGDLYRAAEQVCQEQNTMLLSETKNTIASFITEQDAPFIYEKVGNRFEKFMIDEFQDTSLGEWENFRPLLLNAISQSADIAVLLVGDIKQSIYRWRGSDWNILSSIAPTDLEQRNTPLLRRTLKGNYRSLTNIVEFNNSTMRSVADSKNLHLNSTLSAALADGAISTECHNSLHDALLTAYSSENLEQTIERKGSRTGYVCATAHYTEQPDIVGRVRELIHDKGYAPCDITILVRTRNEAEQIAGILLEAGNADESMRFGVMTQEALKLSSAPAVQFILAVMRYAVERTDVISLAIYNRYCHNFDLYRALTAEEVQFFDTIKNSSTEEAFERIVMRFAHLFEGQSAYTDALHEHIVRFCATKVADLRLFLEWWSENGADKSVTIDKEPNAIEIMTIHKAKGLENKVVIIPYCHWRFIPEAVRPTTIWSTPTADNRLGEILFPVQSSSSAANSIFSEGYYREYVYSHIDAINLLYVALTRPREQLHIFFPVMDPDRSGSFERTAEDIGELLFQLLGMEKHYTAPTDGEPLPEAIVYSVGSFECASASKAEQGNTLFLTNSPTSEYNLRLRLSTERYQQALTGGLSPRNEGIVLHGIMERATTREDIYRAIESLVIDGVISGVESRELTAQIDSALDNSIAGEWFSDKWQSVRTESDIIVPSVGLRRPDRVMTDGKTAVVVDYKFGEQSAQYRKQIAAYCDLLSSMGYSDVKGYIWYVREGKIMEVV